jgi:hypothetical protein
MKGMQSLMVGFDFSVQSHDLIKIYHFLRFQSSNFSLS